MNVWFCSDHHFSHRNLAEKFIKADGSPGRTFIPDDETSERAFHNVEEMDQVMIDRHNKTVGQFEKVYFCGDVCFNLTRFHSIMPRLNGKKRLILGNHDKFHMSEYNRFFEKVMESWQPIRNLLFTHRPILLGEEDHHKKINLNVHGHTHNYSISDKRYMNICLEKTEYRPIHFDEIEQEYKRRGYKLG